VRETDRSAQIGQSQGEHKVARDGVRTRTLIMDAAQDLVLQQGFAATSIDQILARTGITKGAFFYHFKSKADLALALVERYAALDVEHLERTLDRAERLTRDPLQEVLIFVGLLQEEAHALTEPFAGCLYASYCYEAQLFDERTFGVVRAGMQDWRARFAAKVQAALDRHPPRLPATADELAGMILAIFEGSFVLAKILAEPQFIAEQLGHYRNYLELLLAPGTAPAEAVARDRSA
jgi:TetR/AcrR family transcriptional repressor of nem operon